MPFAPLSDAAGNSPALPQKYSARSRVKTLTTIRNGIDTEIGSLLTSTFVDAVTQFPDLSNLLTKIANLRLPVHHHSIVTDSASVFGYRPTYRLAVDCSNDIFKYEQPWFEDFDAAISDSISNAVLHGNGGGEAAQRSKRGLEPAKEIDLRKKAYLDLILTKYFALASVIDEGNGFDHENTQELIDPKKELVPTGRTNAALLKYWTDGFFYRNTGNGMSLVLVKYTPQSIARQN